MFIYPNKDNISYSIVSLLSSETNLKVRQPLADTASMKDSEEALGAFDGTRPPIPVYITSLTGSVNRFYRL